jgi:hypothetical protein
MVRRAGNVLLVSFELMMIVVLHLTWFVGPAAH